MGENAQRTLFASLALAAIGGAAAAGGQDYNPVAFTQPLKLTRGQIVAASPGAAYLSHDESCRLLVSEQGWSPDECGAIENLLAAPAPGIDSALVYKPVYDGHVSFEDWSESKEQIDGIWSGFVETMKAQSQRLNKNLVPESWLVYPTLDKDKAYMYYALVMNWDGHRSINIKGSLFDRSGYVPFLIVPDQATLPGAQVQSVVTRFLASYKSDLDSSYFDFKPGDRVAAIGAAGVLAALLGVKVAKVAAVGFFVTILAFAKKLVFLLVVAPFLGLKRLFAGKRATPPPPADAGSRRVE
jgi:hypothetical protein